MNKILFLAAASFSLLLGVSNAFGEEKTAVASYVIDGDTFATEGGERIRLLHINTPEMGYNGRKSQPFAKEAKAYLKEILEGNDVSLKLGERKTDKHGRLLAHVYLKGVIGGLSINHRMVEVGLAHVYTFPDNRGNIEPLLEAENAAREAKKGLWSHPRWEVLSATSEKLFKDENIGRFHLVKGKVVGTAKVKGTTYLNFGQDWKTDFTVEIPEKFLKNFPKNPHKYYKGKTLLVRGILKPVNGVLVTATHAEQLTE